jgi:hypothetical protein
MYVLHFYHLPRLKKGERGSQVSDTEGEDCSMKDGASKATLGTKCRHEETTRFTVIDGINFTRGPSPRGDRGLQIIQVHGMFPFSFEGKNARTLYNLILLSLSALLDFLSLSKPSSVFHFTLKMTNN